MNDKIKQEDIYILYFILYSNSLTVVPENILLFLGFKQNNF